MNFNRKTIFVYKILILIILQSCNYNENSNKINSNYHKKNDKIVFEVLESGRKTFSDFCVSQKVSDEMRQSFFKKTPLIDSYIKIRVHNKSQRKIYFPSIHSIIYMDEFVYYKQGSDFSYGRVFYNAKENGYKESSINTKEFKDFYLIYPQKVDSLNFAIKYSNASTAKTDSISIKMYGISCILKTRNNLQLNCISYPSSSKSSGGDLED